MEVTIKPVYSTKKRPVIKIMGRFYVFPIFIATFVPRRETLTATRSKAQK
ncbi:hypothetical protein [Phocaeicola sartorii]|nr:hypothetical protein [Phocaeicola sartorii]